MPLNIKDTHWVLTHIDFTQLACASLQWQLKLWHKSWWVPRIMNHAPIHFELAKVFWNSPKISKEMHQFSHSYVENYPRQENKNVFYFHILMLTIVQSNNFLPLFTNFLCFKFIFSGDCEMFMLKYIEYLISGMKFINLDL